LKRCFAALVADLQIIGTRSKKMAEAQAASSKRRHGGVAERLGPHSALEDRTPENLSILLVRS
jgi:hypothetical protein